MDASAENPTGDELLRHARWVRRLAGGLLRDEAAADDLVQDTWVAALSQPQAVGRLRPWLRQVVRNFARQHHRGGARRAQREGVARPPANLPQPEELAERLEAEQRLTRELARLEEPFRSTLMLRYYEDLEPAEIAARLGEPGGTVRWRLMRGLELLRARLDQAFGGDRRAWALALLPLARPEGAVAAGATVTAVAVPGLVAMNVLKIACAAAALLVLALGLSVAGVLPPSLSILSRETPLEVGFRPLEVEEPATPSTLALEGTASEPERIEAAPRPAAEEAMPPVVLLARVDARILGRGRGLAGARLVVVQDGRRLEPVPSSLDGSVECAFPLEAERAFVTIELHALGFASQAREVVCAGGLTTHLGAVELAPGGAVSGRVVDARGAGIPDCLVTLGMLDSTTQRLESARLDPPASEVPGCRTDPAGRFRLIGAPAGLVRLWAHAPDFLGGYTPPLEVRDGQESTGVELVLEALAPTNRVRGIVLDPAGNPVPGSPLRFRHESSASGTVTSGDRRADSGGRFEFILREDSRLWLSASDPAGRWNPGTVSNVPTGEREVVVTLVEARQVDVVVRSRVQDAVAAFGVELVTPEGGARLGGLPREEREGGRGRIALPTEPFLLRVSAAGHRAAELGPFDPRQVGDEIAVTLEAVPGIHGRVVRRGAPVAGVRVVLQAAVGADEQVEKNGFRVRIHPNVLDEARTDEEGRFLLTPSAPGSHYARAMPAAGPPCEVGPFEIGPALEGPPLELVLGVGGAIEGRVRLAGGADPEGSIVSITRGDGHERTQRVGPFGDYRFDGLVAGPWRVALCDREVLDSRTTVSSTRGHRVEPFDLKPNCTVYDGQTTTFDVGDRQGAMLAFEGVLRLDGQPARGWAAKLGPKGMLDFGGDRWEPLDADGRFRLRVEDPGVYTLGLRLAGGETREQYLFDDVHVSAGAPPWERDLGTATLELDGLATWDGNGVPAVVHYWKGPGALFVVTTPVGGEDGPVPFQVPAGKAELRAPTRTPDLEAWPRVRAFEIPRGGSLRITLSPSELPRPAEEPR